MKTMIYQFGNLAGFPFVLAKGFRDKGYKSINVIAENKDRGGVTNRQKKSNRQLPYDRVLSKISDFKIKKFFDRLFFTLKVTFNGIVIHYHGDTILPYNIDTFIFKLFKIPMIMSWGGGDARIVSEALKFNPYFYRYEAHQKDKKIRKKLKRLSNNNVHIATDPELATYSKSYFNQIYTFRAPIDIKRFEISEFNPNKEKPVFLHIPTHPYVKGTIHIVNAFKKLEKEGLNFEFKNLECNLSQQQVRYEMLQCDAYVDQIRCGSYGISSLEAMASRKPTFTYIREDLIEKFPSELPIINSNPDTICDNLRDFILNPEKLLEVGKKSREYVEKYHDVNVVVDDMLELYRELGIKI